MTESLLRVCRSCSRYTLKDACPQCGSASRTPHPARYSPQDRWGRYRRALLDAVAAPAAPGG